MASLLVRAMLIYRSVGGSHVDLDGAVPGMDAAIDRARLMAGKLR
jgi:hypothetical protein